MNPPLPALWIAGAAGGLAQSLAGVGGTLMARRLGGSDWTAGLPQGLMVLGAAVAAVVLARMMSGGARRPGLVTGGAVATAGCATGALAAGTDSIALLALASVLVGWGVCAVMFARYAAADLGGAGDRARLLASVLAAISVGAVVGPNLLVFTGWLDRAWGLSAGSGAYLVSGLAFAATTIVWSVGLPAAAPPARPDIAVSTDGYRARRLTSRTVTALGVLSLANLVMVATMTMAPIQLQVHDGSGLGVIGLVVSAHIAAMFAPSPLSGRLVHRAGERPALLVACLVSVAATGLAAAGAMSAGTMAAAMVLLGLGWNIATVTASTMLTGDVPLAHRASLEGWGEVGMGLAAAVGGGLSGVVMAGAGYAALAVVGLAVVLVGLLPLGLRASTRPKPQLEGVVT